MYEKSIAYDRETHDYAMFLDEMFIGYARTYHEAEVTLNQTAYEWLSHGYTATELDGAHAECSEPDNMCSVHDPCPLHAEAAARYLAEQPPRYTRDPRFDNPQNGDAWRDQTGLLRWVAVGANPNA